MQEIISMILLGVIQGITEWLPISSSGHLVVFSKIFGYTNSIEFDVALHFGTLMAVFVYFGKDIVDIVEAFLKGKWESENGKMFFLLAVSAIPAAAAGFLLQSVFENAFSSLLITTFGFGITTLVLVIASLGPRGIKENPTYLDSFLIGCAQAVAIVPGISRSGATISAGLLRGMSMKSALKFSFLMSIPVIFGANALEIGNATLPSSFIIPTFAAFLAGLITIHILFRILITSKSNLRWFAIYTFLLALGIVSYLILNN